MMVCIRKIIQLILHNFTYEYFVFERNQNFLNNVHAMHEDLRLSKKGPLRFFTAGLQEVPPPFLYFLKKNSLHHQDSIFIEKILYFSFFVYKNQTRFCSQRGQFRNFHFLKQLCFLFVGIKIRKYTNKQIYLGRANSVYKPCVK